MLLYRHAPVVGSSTSSHSWQFTSDDDRYTTDRHQRRATAAGQRSSSYQPHHPHHDIVKTGECSQQSHETCLVTLKSRLGLEEQPLSLVYFFIALHCISFLVLYCIVLFYTALLNVCLAFFDF